MIDAFVTLQLNCRGNPGKEKLLTDWLSFAESRDEISLLKTLPTTPKGGPIDWIRLYEEVVARGGFKYVSRNKLWKEIISPSCLNLDVMPYVIASYYQK
jgi:hypothetical protein